MHIWRICADHDEPFMHLDDAYAAICRLFTSPTSSSLSHHHLTNDHVGGDHVHGDQVGESHMRIKAALLQKLQLQASCQAFLLLASLVRHAIRCALPNV